MIDKDRVFYANAFQVAVTENEAVLVFKLRDLTAAFDPEAEPKTILKEAMEVARIHMPKALMDSIIADFAQRHKEALQQKEEAKGVTS